MDEFIFFPLNTSRLFLDQKTLYKDERGQGWPHTHHTRAWIDCELMGLNPGCGRGRCSSPPQGAFFLQRSQVSKALGCHRQRTTEGTSFPCSGDWPAWVAVGAKVWLSAIEPVCLLKFLLFCRSVLPSFRLPHVRKAVLRVTAG